MRVYNEYASLSLKADEPSIKSSAVTEQLE